MFIRTLLARTGWRPATILMVGIAGGIGAGIAHGDVVVAAQIIDYEGNPAGKASAWSVYQTDAEALSQLMAPSTGWRESVAESRPDGNPREFTRLFSGAVLSSNHVICSVDEREHLRSRWCGVLAVEMEAAGVVAAIEATNSRSNLAMVRGIADLADGAKSTGWREYCAQIAAAVAWDYIERFEPPVSRPLPIARRSDASDGTTTALQVAADVFFSLGQFQQLIGEIDEHWQQLPPEARDLPSVQLIQRLTFKQQEKLGELINKVRDGLFDLLSAQPVNAEPARTNPRQRPAGQIDLLIATALGEENRVVRAILGLKATAQTTRFNDAPVWDYVTSNGDCYRIASISAYNIGETSMAIATTDWLTALAPRFAVLVGIAAAVDTKGLQLGDVPFASEVIGYGDIAVEDHRFTYRPSGLVADERLKWAAGELCSDLAPYARWQQDCREVITAIVPTLNALSHNKLALDEQLTCLPHLIIGVTGSGPFLLRDADFRDKLRKIPDHTPPTIIGGFDISGPIHPKLVSAEMDAYGFVKACHNKEIPASVIKGISDLGDSGKNALEAKSGGFFRAFACSNAVLALLHMLEFQPRRPRG
jgi:nucleoside phosphorylase